MIRAIATLALLLGCTAQAGTDERVWQLIEGLGDPQLHIAAEAALRRDLAAGPAASHDAGLLLLDLWLRLRPDRVAGSALLSTLPCAADPRSLHDLRIAAHRQRRLGEIDRARALSREAGRVDPADPLTMLVRALEAREDGEYTDSHDGAIPLLEALVANHPDRAIVLYLLVDTLRIAGRAPRALAHLDRFAATCRAQGIAGLGNLIWASGLAADIEARDLGRPRAASARCAALLCLTDGASVESQQHAQALHDWYARSAAEAAAHRLRRDSLLRLASASLLGWLLLAGYAWHCAGADHPRPTVGPPRQDGPRPARIARVGGRRSRHSG